MEKHLFLVSLSNCFINFLPLKLSCVHNKYNEGEIFYYKFTHSLSFESFSPIDMGKHTFCSLSGSISHAAHIYIYILSQKSVSGVGSSSRLDFTINPIYKYTVLFYRQYMYIHIYRYILT